MRSDGQQIEVEGGVVEKLSGHNLEYNPWDQLADTTRLSTSLFQFSLMITSGHFRLISFQNCLSEAGSQNVS